MTSAMLLMEMVLNTTSLEMAIIIMTTGLGIYTMIGHILMMGIVGAMRVKTARTVDGLSVIPLRGDLSEVL